MLWRPEVPQPVVALLPPLEERLAWVPELLVLAVGSPLPGWGWLVALAVTSLGP